MNLSSLIANYEPQSSPFATHVNLLRAVGAGVHRVLELGAGQFSTPLFLDRDHYPALDWLVTVEDNKDWAAQAATSDPRHVMVVVNEPIYEFLPMFDMDMFDLIFCDNSASGGQRCETLKWLAENTGNVMVVAHDWQVPSYREAGAGFTHQFIDDRQEPWTALLWK